jgi:arginyl-tRNA synthetase
MEIALEKSFGSQIGDISEALVVPTQPIHGDYQSNVALTLTKKLKMKPKEIAEKIISALDIQDIVSVISITGPGFISMKLSENYIQSQIINKLYDKSRLNVSPLTNPQRIVVDFSSPNIAKEMHVVMPVLIYITMYLLYSVISVFKRNACGNKPI